MSGDGTQLCVQADRRTRAFYFLSRLARRRLNAGVRQHVRLLKRLVKRRPDITKRVVADRSGREIADLQDFYGHELRTSVYFYASKLVLAAPTTGTPGNVHAELRPPVVAEEPVSDEQLGYIALHGLLMFEGTPVPSLRNYKLADWTTYQASGAPSVKAFNRGSVCVAIHARHGSLRIEASPSVPEDSAFGVFALASISVTHHELGQVLRKVVRGAKALQDVGVV